MKVLLINPHETGQSGFTSPPPGLLYLAGNLIRNSIDVDFVDGCLNGLPAIINAINEYRPDMVGISCLTLFRNKSIEVAQLVKKINPEIQVTFGGAHASIMYEQLLTTFSCIDFIVIGEGEQTFLELVQGCDIETIDGLAYLKEGKVVTNRPRMYVENLDDLPFPAWHLIDFTKYPALGKGLKNGIRLAKTPRVPVVFSRGCKGRCDFCSSWWIWKKWRHRSPGNMADELEMLCHRYGVRHFCFVDDAMTVDRQAIIDLCDEIITRKLEIVFHITTRTDCVDEVMLKKLKQAGCYQIAYGVETGSPELLKNILKENTVEVSERAIRLTKAAGIHATALIMVGNIGETSETITDTLNLLKRSQPDDIGSGVGLYIMPGTKLYQECKRMGIIDDDFWLSNEPFRIYTEEHSLEELSRMIRVVANYRPTSKKITVAVKRFTEILKIIFFDIRLYVMNNTMRSVKR